LNIQPIGGWDMQILLGQYLTVCGRNGPITGVVSRRAPHLLTSEEKNKVPQFQDIWVDIGVKDKKEAEELVKIGDPVVFALGLRRLRNSFAASPGMDDKVGVWTVVEALRLLDGRPVQASIYAVSTVQEEIGLRGATTSSYGIDPHLGIAVDVTHATDTPGNDKKQIGEVKLGGGPVLYRGPNINPKVLLGLEAAAARLDIKVQMRGAPKATGTDANAIQLTRDGVATGLIGLPNRYMHSPVEMISLDDIDRAADLLAGFALRLAGDEKFTP
jgi:endoglucanase